MARGGRLIACAAGALAFAVGGCSGDDIEPGPDPDASPDGPCPVTEPAATEDLPEVLREAGGQWTGREGLWASVPDREFVVDDGPRRLKHAWVTLDGDGALTAELGDPGVTLQRLDGPGQAVASHGGYATDATLSWWPTVVDFPSPGCWAETGSVAGVEVRLVFEVP